MQPVLDLAVDPREYNTTDDEPKHSPAAAPRATESDASTDDVARGDHRESGGKVAKSRDGDGVDPAHETEGAPTALAPAGVPAGDLVASTIPWESDDV